MASVHKLITMQKVTTKAVEAQTLDCDTAPQDSQEENICASLQGPGDNHHDLDLYTKSHAYWILCLEGSRCQLFLL